MNYAISTLIIIAILIILYLEGKIISSSAIWLLCFFMIFIVAPKYYEVSNKDLVSGYSLIAIIAFAIGWVICNAIARNGVRINHHSIKEEKLSIQVIKYANVIIAVITVLLLVMSIGIYGIQSVLAGDTTSSQSLESEGSIKNIYLLSLYALSSVSLYMYFATDGTREKKVTWIFIGLFLVQTGLFSYARSGVIYAILIIGMYEIRNMDKRSQIIRLVLIGLACIVLMIFGGYNRSFGTAAAKDFFTYLSEVEDTTKFLLHNLDFSAAYVWFSRLIERTDIWISPIVYIKPFISFIPRSVIPWKPEALTVQVLRELSPGMASRGYSTGMSILGETYVVLGRIGFVIYPFAWGVVCALRDNMHFLRIRTDSYLPRQYVSYYYFSTMIVIESHRGDLSSVLTNYLVAYALPVLVVDYFARNKQIAIDAG